jgi:beta-lactamase superfamily II metal-dependent hydrolase
MNNLKILAQRILSATILVFIFTTGIFAGDLTYFPLSREGQASVTYDEQNNWGIIVDYGGEKDGKVPLTAEFDKLKERKIKKLFILCSHPHADHLQGIRDFFKQVKEEKYRLPKTLEEIVVIDDGISSPYSLVKEIKASIAAHSKISVTYKPANGRNAFEKYYLPTDKMYIQTIPYEISNQKSKHGRAIITFFNLDGYKHLDFDDAESAVVRKAVDTLKRQGITKINSYTPPHHGSEYHNNDPIFELNPETVIFTVNKENRHGHPSAPVLKGCMDRFKPENVIFTGSEHPVVISSKGLIETHHTASQTDSYTFFVQPNEERLKKQKAKASTARLKIINDNLALYKEVGAIMRQDGGDQPPPPNSSTPDPDNPPSPSSSPSTGNKMLQEKVQRTGSILTSDFSLGALSINKDLAVPFFQNLKIFPVKDSDLLLVTLEVPLEESKANYLLKAQKAQRDIILSGKKIDKKIAIASLSRNGFPSVLGEVEMSSLTLSQPLPKGGMVYLNGGKLIPIGQATELISGKLDICGQKFCVKVSSEGEAEKIYDLPFSPSPLFSEIWTRVYDKDIKSFYLSINPTKRMINNLKNDIQNIPMSKLFFGENSKDPHSFNEVVTSGNIEKSKIGHILWEADVIFKSRSLGFDVLKGNNNPQWKLPTDLTKYLEATQKQGLDRLMNLAVPRHNRWCRLYWTNGEQQISINKPGKIMMSGDAVIARSEPMRLKNGDLEDYPEGDWCREPKQVAFFLQKLANSPINTNKTLKDLRQLAEIQNFIIWAKSNDISASDAFREKLNAFNTSVNFEVPKWTSGIRTKPLPLLVQLEENYKGSIFPSVHIGNVSNEQYECMVKLWNEQEHVFPEQGLHKDSRNTWSSSDEQGDIFIKNWMNNLALRISTGCGGQLLPPLPSKAKSLLTNRTFGIISHSMYEPIEIHGGVMLGVQKELIDKVKADGFLVSPSRKLLFQKDNEDLHFWNFVDNDQFGNLGQHVIIKDGSLTNISFPTDGVLRFEVKIQPWSIVREELRAKKTDTFTKGVEWLGAKSDDESVIYEKVAWACTNTESNKPCIGIADMSSEKLFQSYMVNKGSIRPLIKTRRISNDKWVVELNISGFANDFDKNWEKVKFSDVNKQISALLTYTKWGFRGKAMKIYWQIFKDAEAIDTIVRKLIAPEIQ